MEEFDSKSELLANLQSLRQDKGYKYIMGIVEAYGTQASEDVLLKRNIGKEDENRGEWIAYRRVGKVLDKTIEELQAAPQTPTVTDLDAFTQPKN